MRLSVADMKTAPALAAVAWLAVSAFAGYLLTARSFSWIDAAAARGGSDKASVPVLPDTEVLKARLPEIARDPESWFRQLSAAQQSCLEKTIAPERYRAAIENRDFIPTLAELRAAATCLK